MTLKPFPEIENTHLFLCGGAVRDELLGRPYKDRDYVAITEYSFDELVKAIERSSVGNTVYLAKPEFLTIRCMMNKEAIDIALPRGEGDYADNRHPSQVERLDSLEEDASRRDLTINAMFMRKDGTVLDFFGGQQDLRLKSIRAVGLPLERFNEDALRILRAIRFALRLGFSIDANTLLAMMGTVPLLRHISADRIREELSSCLHSNMEGTFKWIDRLNLWDILEEKGVHFEATQEGRLR